MKRHQALVPLSHDHHQALLVALRLKKGGPASARDNWPIEPDAQRKALFDFADRELLPHFTLEEELIFPECLKSNGEIKTLAEDLSRDHNEMRSLLTGIGSAPPAELLRKMAEFGTLLEAHVRKEERSFFPLVEAAIAQKSLAVDTAILAEQHARYRTPPACDV
jgi:iron-sulfur cluster repair protein YtfE (RIC family)